MSPLPYSGYYPGFAPRGMTTAENDAWYEAKYYAMRAAHKRRDRWWQPGGIGAISNIEEGYVEDGIEYTYKKVLSFYEALKKEITDWLQL